MGFLPERNPRHLTGRPGRGLPAFRRARDPGIPSLPEALTATVSGTVGAGGTTQELLKTLPSLGLPPGAVATERDGLAADTGDRKGPISGANERMANAHYTSALAGHGIRCSIVRLPPATHGNGDNGFIPAAIGFAREKGAAAYVGDGANRWPAVHRDDAARLFRLALESAPAGSVLHAVGDQGVPIREVAEIFAAHLGCVSRDDVDGGIDGRSPGCPFPARYRPRSAANRNFCLTAAPPAVILSYGNR